MDTNQILELLENARFSDREEVREINISRETVLGKLMGLRTDKSPGPDNLHPTVLKEVALEMGKHWWSSSRILLTLEQPL